MATTKNNIPLCDSSVAANPRTSFPVDTRSYFEQYSAAVEAASKAVVAGDTSGKFYIGQTITVFDEAGDKSISSFYIGNDKQLHKFAVDAEMHEDMKAGYVWLSGSNTQLCSHAISGENEFLSNVTIANGKLSVGTDTVIDLSSIDTKTITATDICVDFSRLHDQNTTYTASQLCTLLSNDISCKIFVKNPETELSNGKFTNLSVVKCTIDEYENNVANNALLNNCLYVISADYLETYGEKICNVAMGDDPTATSSYLGLAATDTYVKSTFLPLSGGQVTGSLILSGDPTLDNEATTKHYVDTLSGSSFDALANLLSSDSIISTFYETVKINDGVDQIELQYAVSALYQLVKIMTKRA